jgi:hypothetical protein
MRRIILSCVACLAIQCFSTLSHKRHDFRGKKVIEQNIVFWFLLQLLSKTFLILRRIQQDITINIHRTSRKVPVIVVRLLWNLNFLGRFFEKSPNINYHENPSSGSRDRQTDMTKRIVAFHNFSNAPKNASKNVIRKVLWYLGIGLNETKTVSRYKLDLVSSGYDPMTASCGQETNPRFPQRARNILQLSDFLPLYCSSLK